MEKCAEWYQSTFKSMNIKIGFSIATAYMIISEMETDSVPTSLYQSNSTKNASHKDIENQILDNTTLNQPNSNQPKGKSDKNLGQSNLSKKSSEKGSSKSVKKNSTAAGLFAGIIPDLDQSSKKKSTLKEKVKNIKVDEQTLNPNMHANMKPVEEPTYIPKEVLNSQHSIGSKENSTDIENDLEERQVTQEDSPNDSLSDEIETQMQNNENLK